MKKIRCARITYLQFPHQIISQQSLFWDNTFIKYFTFNRKSLELYIPSMPHAHVKNVFKMNLTQRFISHFLCILGNRLFLHITFVYIVLLLFSHQILTMCCKATGGFQKVINVTSKLRIKYKEEVRFLTIVRMLQERVSLRFKVSIVRSGFT